MTCDQAGILHMQTGEHGAQVKSRIQIARVAIVIKLRIVPKLNGTAPVVIGKLQPTGGGHGIGEVWVIPIGDASGMDTQHR